MDVSKIKISEHFTRSEFKCPCCDFDTVDVELIKLLEDLRDCYNRPILISSGSRCPTHNARVGGSKRSQHKYGKAADIVVVGVHENEVADYLEKLYPAKYGIGHYPGRTHIDVRTKKARWDRR